MSRARVAIDIDDVLVDRVMSIQAYLNTRFGSALDVRHMRPGESFFEFVVDHFAGQVGRQELSEVIEAYVSGPEYMAIPPMDMAIDIVRKLTDSYELVAVSQRPKSQHKATNEWLQKYFGSSFKTVAIINSGHFGQDILPEGVSSKAEYCHEQMYEYLVDDRLKTCLEAAEYGIQALLFGHYPWNAPLHLPQSVARVKDWRSVEEFFDERGNA